MTKHYAETQWRGALYNALRAAPDGVAGFCSWAAEFRERKIASKTLYKRLDGSDPAERMTIEDAELITEYLLRHCTTRSRARTWIVALAAQHDLAAIELDAPPSAGGWPCEITAIMEKGFTLSEQGGVLSGMLAGALRDRQISAHEAEGIRGQAHAEIRMLLRLVRNVERAAEQGATLATIGSDE
ncbi:phage regulatory CII family protein [Bordetella bronchiseptica]|uniref:phage regulatory CII family protein n=1 Tax=Bordetella bronchiseptica TaxID=518 RepID=UPI00067ABD87|nr:phage regulatory CII family protein [Bordetella bronchiseptica]AZW31518.1 hypothetical protein CS343_15235 [Bordetella bronchiseptica]